MPNDPAFGLGAADLLPYCGWKMALPSLAYHSEQPLLSGARTAETWRWPRLRAATAVVHRHGRHPREYDAHENDQPLALPTGRPEHAQM